MTSENEEELKSIAREFYWAWDLFSDLTDDKPERKPDMLRLKLYDLFRGRLDEAVELEKLCIKDKRPEYNKIGFAGLTVMFSVLDFIANFYTGNIYSDESNKDIKKLIANELGLVNAEYKKHTDKLIDIRNLAIHNQLVPAGIRLMPGKDPENNHLKIINNEFVFSLYKFRVDIQALIENMKNITFINPEHNRLAMQAYEVVRTTGNFPPKQKKEE